MITKMLYWLYQKKVRFLRMTYTTEQALDLLADATDMVLSPEQTAILTDKGSHPVLINASAGSGKTTTLIMSMLMKYLTGQVDAVSDILGVTFSKKAQLNMTERFIEMAFKVVNAGVAKGDYSERLFNLLVQRPELKTFHSLFNALVKTMPAHRGSSVLASYYELADMLYPEMTHFDDHDAVSRSDYLANIFEKRQFVLNRAISGDGLLTTQQVADLGFTVEFGEDYNAVLTKYAQLKKRLKYIDFDDMKTILVNAIGTKTFAQFIKPELKHISFAFVDEFQDIDTMQALLISKILPKRAFDQLLAVGDDDQSIYSFRGSNPEIILNFKQSFPNARVYPLATNYRTGGNILPLADKLIRHNVRRLTKTLQSGRLGLGTTMITDDWQEFVQDLIAPKQGTTAVLTRRNIEGQIIADNLALQDNLSVLVDSEFRRMDDTPIYKAYRDLYFAFWDDNLDLFLNSAKIIGFSSYAEHVNSIALGDDNITSVTSYVAHASDHYHEFTPGFHLHNNKNADTSVANTMTAITQLKNRVKTGAIDSPAKQVVTLLLSLTERYSKFMISRGLWQSGTFTSTITHLTTRVSDLADFDAYQQQAEHIASRLTHANPSGDVVTIMTLHKSKGLEFDNVYLLGLDQHSVSDDNYDWHARFGTIASKREFISWATAHQQQASAFLLSVAVQSTSKDMNLSVDPIVLEYEIDNWLSGDATTLSPSLKALLNRAYHLIITNNQYVEEERRLFYVGMTRARSKLVMFKSDEPSALFQDLE